MSAMTGMPTLADLAPGPCVTCGGQTFLTGPDYTRRLHLNRGDWVDSPHQAAVSVPVADQVQR